MMYAQGREMAMHKDLRKRAGIAAHFCDPHSHWQRDSNENMKGLVRQYLPNGTILSAISQEVLDAIADEIKKSNPSTQRFGLPSTLSVYRELLLNNTQHYKLIH
jgi:IS30 family transposase